MLNQDMNKQHTVYDKLSINTFYTIRRLYRVKGLNILIGKQKEKSSMHDNLMIGMTQ